MTKHIFRQENKHMKRIFACFLILVSLFALVGCQRITIKYEGNATLKFCEVWDSDTADITQVLTEEESYQVKKYLTESTYLESGAGCPFDENISIIFGDRIFAVSCDDCPTIKDVISKKYYRMSDEGREYIVSLFKKYVGYFPFP